MKQKLLIIDDDEAIFTLLKQIFIKKYSVYTAYDGVEALCYLSDKLIPDLIITDLNMDNINGYELIKHLSSSKILNKIPVIVLSNMPRIETEDLKRYPIVAEVFAKPFDPLVLSNFVGKLLSGKNTTIFNHIKLSSGNILNPLN
ncbi:MAG: response regulator [Ilyomonas sp.]